MGSCFPKDTRALVKTALDHGVNLRIIESVLAVNDLRKRAMAGGVANALGGQLRGKIIGVLGLTFKPETDDMREAPSLSLIGGLHDMGQSLGLMIPWAWSRLNANCRMSNIAMTPMLADRAPTRLFL